MTVEARATLNPEQAFRVLGIGRSGGYAAIRRGEIPSIRIGRRILIPTIALEDLLAQSRNE